MVETGSGWLLLTLMVLEFVPTVVGVATMLMLESKAEASAPIVQLTTPFACTQLPGVAVAETNVRPLGRVSVKTTPVASCGP